MEIRPIDMVKIVEQTSHDDRAQPQPRQQRRKKRKALSQIPTVPVYKANGQLEEEPPPNIDVLV
jgi:hypothetical protein